METRVDTVIFAVKIDNTEAVKQSADLAKEIDELISKQQEMVAQGEKNSAQFVENASALRILKKEQTDLNRSIDNSAKSFMQASGSINQMRANLSNMTQAYNKLSKEERENAAVGGKLQAQMKSLSDELKKNEGAVGDNRRSVGDYEGSIKRAAGEIKLFGVDIGAIGNKFKTAKDAFGEAGDGVKKMGAGMQVVATGAMLGLSILIGGIIALLTKFEPVVEKIEFAMKGLAAAADVLVGTFIDIGKAIVAMDFKNIRLDLGEMTAEMAAAAKEGYAIAKAFDAIDEATTDGIITSAQYEKAVAGLNVQLKDRTRSDQERLEIAAKISKLEEAEVERKFQIADATVKAIARENVAAMKAGTINEEMRKKFAEAYAARDIIQAEFEANSERRQNRVNMIVEQAAEKETKAAEKRVKALEELDKAAAKLQTTYEKLLDEFDKQADEQTKIYFDALNKRREKAKEATDNFYAAEQTALVNSYAQNLITTEQYNAALEQLELDKLEKERANLITNFEDTTQIDLAIAQKRLEIKKANTDSIVNLDKVEKESKQQLVNTAMGLVNDLASSLQAGKEAQKAIALANAGINLGTAIGNLVAATSAPSADNLLTGGLAGAAKFGVLVAQAISSVGSAVATISAAAGGGTFYTSKPTLLMVGDNPSGRERVTVEPLGSRGTTVFNKNSGLVKMAGGGTMISDGGATFDKVSSAGNAMFDMQQMIKSMPAPIVKVVDINRVERNRARIVKVSELN